MGIHSMKASRSGDMKLLATLLITLLPISLALPSLSRDFVGLQDQALGRNDADDQDDEDYYDYGSEETFPELDEVEQTLYDQLMQDAMEAQGRDDAEDEIWAAANGQHDDEYQVDLEEPVYYYDYY